MKKLTALLAVCMMIVFRAAAEPLRISHDLEDSIRIGLNGNSEYIYSFCFPQVEAEDEASELINSFYQYRADDIRDFEIPMNADYYRTQDLTDNVTTEISYTVTCNNDDFFSVLLSTDQDGWVVYTGHTFTRKELQKGTTVALPYLLGLLDSGVNDEWLQERQTAKANAAVREMVWDALEEKEDFRLRPGFQEEDLEYVFFPEEDFYLDEEGNPVFYLQPGAADDSGLLTVFPISVDEILDEM